MLSSALFFCAPHLAWKNDVDALLISREQQKWKALSTKSFGAHAEWFAEDFVSIGYLPDASVYRTGFGKQAEFPDMADFPAATFELSGFKTVDAAPGVKVLSYQADGPVNLYATTVWAKRKGQWKSVFYQATKYK